MKQSGFILDGFPRSSGQAAALEKCLTGLDFEAQNAKKENASKIAPPPDPVRKCFTYPHWECFPQVFWEELNKFWTLCLWSISFSQRNYKLAWRTMSCMRACCLLATLSRLLHLHNNQQYKDSFGCRQQVVRCQSNFKMLLTMRFQSFSCQNSPFVSITVGANQLSYYRLVQVEYPWAKFERYQEHPNTCNRHQRLWNHDVI